MKHSAALAARPLGDEAADTVCRGGADALIVSGAATGQPTDLGEITAVRTAAPGTPVLIGSGVSPETIAESLRLADGAIVGTALKKEGLISAPIDPARVQALMRAIR